MTTTAPKPICGGASPPLRNQITSPSTRRRLDRVAAWSLAVRFGRRDAFAEKANAARTKPPDSPIDARAGYVFHNGGAKVMGSAQALPERIDRDMAERVAGRHFCSTDFDALATQTPGFISREAAQRSGARAEPVVHAPREVAEEI